MDFILGRFADANLPTMSDAQLAEYEAIVSNVGANEWDLYYYITGTMNIPDEMRSETLDMIREFTLNNKLRS